MVSLLTPIFLAGQYLLSIQSRIFLQEHPENNEARVFYCMMRELREKLFWPVCVYWESN